MKHVLYLTRNGLLEPLGRSQVFGYLRALSRDYVITLVTFEKPEDLLDHDAVTRAWADCEAYGIRWLPRRFRSRPRLVQTVWSVVVLSWLSLREVMRGHAHVVHSRSYIPAIASWVSGTLTQTPFIFDMRAIWPDEMVTAGRLKERSFVYKVLKWLERRLLRNAASVISLTEAGMHHLLERYPEIPSEKFEVITTCVDVDRFRVPERHGFLGRLEDRHPFVVGTMGTLLSGWFYLDAFFAFFLAIKILRPDAQASIVTRDDHRDILLQAQRMGVDPEDVTLRSATPEEMPALLASMDVGVMFYAPDVGRAPTRLGEFLAAGVPVVGNTGIGDLERLITTYEVGVVIGNLNDAASLKRGARKLLDRYDTVLASGACRHAAEDYFSVEQGAAKYRKLYRLLLSKSHNST